jgi:hypothetical protein
MGLVFGIDEAGYGPNLGPLVITVTCWETPGRPAELDFWSALGSVISQIPTRAAGTGSHSASSPGPREKLHVGDSKAVYTPQRGLAALETSVLSLLGCDQSGWRCLNDLWLGLGNRLPGDDSGEPWFQPERLQLPIPLAADPGRISAFAERLRAAFNDSGIRLRSARSDIVLTQRFNRLTDDLGSKGALLSQATLQLLRAEWNPPTDGEVLILADKHGGRSNYHAQLVEILDGLLPLCIQEGREHSRYRVLDAELRFEAKSERHFPVAVSSMISKYVRELSMEAFNRFWREHAPDVAPTKGYPGDAVRFRNDVAAARRRLAIPDASFWRAR